MSVPSMVHRSGDTLIVRSVVSGDALFGSADAVQENKSNLERRTINTINTSGGGNSNNFDDKDLPECKVKRNYSCNTCDFFTQNPRHYLYHLRDVHEEKVRIYECPNCLYASKHFQKLLRHTKMVHGNTGDGLEDNTEVRIKTRKRSAAPIEEEEEEEEEDDEEPSAAITTTDVDGGDEYEEENERISVFKCSVCAFTARSRSQLNRHEREEHIKTKFFRCLKCTYVTHMKARFTKHVKYHSMPMIKCDMCDFRTPYKWNLDRHCKNHNGRGAFRCSACNFTADIKQSLTVHEMNHHVPPVGQAAGLGVGRRRNKVGASDATAAEEAAHRQQQQQQQQQQHTHHQVIKTEFETNNERTTINRKSTNKHHHHHHHEGITTTAAATKKSKASNNSSNHHHQQINRSFGPDFIHPDDIIHHASGNVYIKNKCKLCNYKSAWIGEMAKHEKKVHNIIRETIPSSKVTKKPSRPIPNLIPIPSQTSVLKITRSPSKKSQELNESSNSIIEPIMSQQDINDICAKSANSALKDFASLFGSEDVFKNISETETITTTTTIINPLKVPDLIPASIYTSTPKNNNNNNNNQSGKEVVASFKQKNASFFDKLKERLMTGADGDNCNLICKYCGYESKCLTEQAKHQKICGTENNQMHILTPTYNISSSRCQYCRQRCKSSADLYNHLQICLEASKIINCDERGEGEEIIRKQEESEEGELKIDESQSEEDSEIIKPHPMENRVFVWNNIEVPMDIEIDDSNYEYTEDNNKVVDDNISLDLSIRTQSPGGSENSYIGQDYNNIHHHSSLSITDKIPTHGNDISIAQHKRVFKCPHCSFWASTASRFHVHIVGHLNKKPFECSLCAYRSNWRWDITKHIKLKSVRDPAHENAKVLMTDETGRRNYTKYNKYLTEIHVTSGQSMETSGGSGTRPRHHHHDRNNSPNNQGNKSDLPKLTRAPSSRDFSPLLRTPPLRPPPPLKAADGSFFAKVAEKKRPNNENKRTLFKCKKCNFRDASREVLLAHVKGHYPQNGAGAGSSSNNTTPDINLKGSSPEKDEASVNMSAKGSQAPFRCGHCNQVSNWKHVIQRHCRLKHSGDIRVVSNKNGQEKLEMDEQMDEPDHLDVAQEGTFKCNSCPFSNNNHAEFENHLTGHLPSPDSIMKCHYCKYFVSQKDDLLDHLKLHGVLDTEEFLNKILERSTTVDGDSGKRFKCMTCPYVTNSKSQYTYHKQFHKPRGGQYTCSQCSYNVSKRHLLHQHLKVHGINTTPQKQNGEIIDLDEISEEIEEVSSSTTTTNPTVFDAQHFLDIPLVWVSKNGKFSKMFKCRFCPHVNLRKVNIQEHEKMHSIREKNPNSTRLNDVEHRCTECNYVCNNAGVLSSHSKVHQGLYGTVHCLVDPIKSDDEQIRELSKFLNPPLPQIIETINLDDYENAESAALMDTEDISTIEENSLLYFCKECPARFLKENEFSIHSKLHGVRLFYKCEYCSYSARQKPHLLAHNKVHTSEYQERTRVLQTMYITSNVSPQPQIYPVKGGMGELVWIIFDNNNKTNNTKDLDNNLFTTTTTILSKSVKNTVNVPLSGTELYQQKSEAQKQLLIKEPSPSPLPPKPADPQFGTLMHGNPKFIYPTYLKNGRKKEKRYKCHKCPSAFEKREQYKVHLNLHGSKQRYKCEYCDYSVKYYANYVQHLKKHKMNSEAQAAAKSSSSSSNNNDLLLLEDNNMEEIVENNDDNNDGGIINDSNKLSLSDQQAYKILQQRMENNTTTSPPVNIVEEKKLFWCPSCPYTNYRKDAVDNHQKRHINVSGIRSNHTCEHCDYSVPQAHFLRDHAKLHFMPNKMNQIDGYMTCDNLKLFSSKIINTNNNNNINKDNDDNDEEKNDNKNIIFEELGSNNKIEETKQFLPPLSAEIIERFNNNDGEKQFVNLETGEVVVNKKCENSDNNSIDNKDNKMDES